MSFLNSIKHRYKNKELFNTNDDVYAIEGRTIVSNQITPTRKYFSILNIRGDSRYYNKGNIVSVECMDGTNCKGIIKNKYGNVLELTQYLNKDPKLGGKVRKVLGENEDIYMVQEEPKTKIYISGFKK